jgi:hypothetical protein
MGLADRIIEMRNPIETGHATAMLQSASTADFRCRKPSIRSPEIGYFVSGRLLSQIMAKIRWFATDCCNMTDSSQIFAFFAVTQALPSEPWRMSVH